MKKKQFAVIGVGRFGESLIAELARMGHEVLAIDTDEGRIDDIVDIATQSVQADSMEEKVLKALDITSFDAVIVAIGGDLEASILTSITLKELGVKRIIAKAQNRMHGKVLEKMGIDMVIYPERDMAMRLARTLNSNSFLDYIELSPNYSILEMNTPRKWAGHTIGELDLRKVMDITVLAIRNLGNVVVSPSAEQRLEKDDIIVVLGSTSSLDKINEMD